MSRLNLVLACGYLGFRHIGPIEYFNGVAEYLTDRYPVRIVETYVAPPGASSTGATSSGGRS